MSSEVARIRAQIEAEIDALNLLIGAPAIVASHRIIEHKYSCLDSLGNKPSEVGERKRRMNLSPVCTLKECKAWRNIVSRKLEKW
jgi:hypothetical protein